MATTSNTSQPLPWVQPYMQDYLARGQEVANQPYQQSPGTYTAPNPYLMGGWGATANRAMQGSPVMGAANTLAQGTMQGQYLNSNPYLQQNISDAQGDLTRAWNQVQKPAWDTAMQRSGSYGNTGIAQANQFAQSDLQRNLGRVASDMRGQNYAQERGFMQQALGMAPHLAQQDYVDSQALLGVGQQAQQYSQNAANQNMDWWREAQGYPAQQMGILGQALGMQQGQTQTQQTPDPSMWSQVIGGALAGGSIWNSLFGG